MKSRILRGMPAAAGVSLLTAGFPLFAQSAMQPATLSPVTVVASRSAQAVEDVLGDVTVIERGAIERAGHSSLGDVLSRSPGIEQLTYGGPQTPSSIFVRGSNTNQTLVLLDGMRINSATSGGGALNAIPLNDIERIEILRGAAGSLYGADAVGGVVNIITRQGSERPLSVSGSAGFGSHGTSRISTSISGRSSAWRYGLNLGYGQSKGFNSTVPGSFAYNPDNDSYYQRNASGNLGYTWRPGHEVALQAYHSTINGGYDNGEPYVNDRAVQRVEGYSLTSRNQVTDRWHSTLRAGFTRDRGRNENAPAALLPGNSEDGVTYLTTRQNQYGWQNDFELGKHQRFTLAVERLEQRVDGDVADWSTFPPQYLNYDRTERNTNSVTGVYTAALGRHHVQASLRHDDDSQYGGQTTGGAAYGFDLTPTLRATVAGSTAFRAPNFNELYFPGNGNPNLEPEKARNLEASLRYLSGDTRVDLTVYRNRITNMINGWPAENIGRAVLEGITLAGEHQLGRTSLRASLDLQNPHDDATGERLAFRAKRILRLAADRDMGPVRLGAEWFLSGERYASGTRERLGGYGLLDLTASYDLSAQTQLQLRANNVLDKDYTLVPGYHTAGASVFVSIIHRPR